ncbi:MAG: methylated-DNA--[protein]-cysteine S-methyltransferase [Deltaproteobacteria bacterium]
MSQIYYSSVLTRVGEVFVVAGADCVSRIIFGEKAFRDFRDSLNGTRVVEGGAAEKMAKELAQYFEGKLSRFETGIDVPEGTPFQRAVWKKLLDIPYGEVTTYREIAESVGRPGAARAVGNAVGANPLPIVIPCHRVLASNGLGGYTGGIGIKKDLLRIEGVLS